MDSHDGLDDEHGSRLEGLDRERREMAERGSKVVMRHAPRAGRGPKMAVLTDSVCSRGTRPRLQAAIKSDERIRPFGATCAAIRDALQIIARGQGPPEATTTVGSGKGGVREGPGGGVRMAGVVGRPTWRHRKMLNSPPGLLVDLSQSSTCFACRACVCLSRKAEQPGDPWGSLRQFQGPSLGRGTCGGAAGVPHKAKGRPRRTVAATDRRLEAWNA
jgi:hypothetical protein